MKRLFTSLALFGIFVPELLFAQEAVTAPSLSLAQSETTGNVSCFDYYRFGSVQADIETNLSQTVPGADISFKGKLKNDNDYPVINGTLYIKVFQRTESTFSVGDGNTLVDQFPLKETFTIPAKGEKEASFSWHVPENIAGGDYYIATFFATEGRYNLSGLSFTDDVIGNSVSFSVTSDPKNSLLLDKTKTTLNGQNHHFAAFPLHFSKEDTVEAKTTLTNQGDTKQVIRLTWEEYVWDAMRVENQRNKKYELIEVDAKSSKEVSYQVKPQNASVSYLVVTAEDQYAKSIQDIRFVRDGIEETRINFPSLTSFPLKSGEQNALFACAHSTNLPVVKDNILTLTLRDEDQNIIHTYKYQGDISGAMGGWKDDFTPTKDYNKVFLTATLQRNNQVVEEVTIPYDCEMIDQNLCTNTTLSNILPGKKLGIILVSLLSLIALLAIVLNKMKHTKRNNRFKVLFLALMLGGLFFGGGQVVEGKSVSWNTTSVPELWYYWSGNIVGFFNGPSAGWAKGLASNASVTISYTANVYNQSTGGLLVPDNGVVNVGDQLRFEPTPHTSRDISWFGTGLSSDSPNGDWVANADIAPAARATPSAVFITLYMSTCQAKDYVGTDGAYSVFIPLSINPPNKIISHSGTASLTCNASNSLCTVTGPGTINTSFRFDTTFGKFYNRYRHFGGTVCVNDNSPMALNISGSPYQLSVPVQTIPFTLTAVSGNNPPTPPTLTGPTTGSTSVAYPFTTQATDPDGDTVRYGLDWDNNGSVDEWTTFVPSGTVVNTNHQWATNGTYTIQALTHDGTSTSGWSIPLTINIQTTVNGTCGSANAFPTTNPPTIGLCFSGTSTPVTPAGAPGPYSWTCTGSGGGVDATCSAPYLEPAPVVDLKINASDGPLTVNRNSNLNLTWGSILNATTCTGSGTNWDTPPAKSILGGNDNIPANSPSLYTLTCTNSQGISSSDSVSVTLQNTFKICQNSCDGGDVPNPLGMVQGSTRQIVGCFNDATTCIDPTGDVTPATTWNDAGGPEITLSNTGLITAVQEGSESMSATYGASSQNRTINVSCVAQSCSASEALKYCTNETFSWPTGCAATPTQTCSGSKSCDFNWKEVAP